MLELILICAIAIFLGWHFLHVKDKQSNEIPGLDPKDKVNGNLPDIQKAGTLHFFLRDLHHRFGPIASFWWGPRRVVSVSTAELFRQTSRSFNRPAELFSSLDAIIGPSSIQFANGEIAHIRHSAIAKSLSPEAMKQYFDHFNEQSKALVSKWKTIPVDEPVSVCPPLFEFSIKTVLVALMGKAMKDESRVKVVQKAYRVLWWEVERRIGGGSEPDIQQRQEVDEQREAVYKILSTVYKDRKANPPGAGEYLPIDAILELDLDAQTVRDDLMTLLVGGFHNVALLVSWTIYFIAKNQDVQQKLHEEVDMVVSDNEIDPENIKQLTYLRQVLDEALRITSGLFAARYNDTDAIIGGYTVPAKTPIVHAISVVLHDREIYPDPVKFDPERFSPASVKKRQGYAFEPFGFGKRRCIGYMFAQNESLVVLAHIVKNFNLASFGDQHLELPYTAAPNPKEDILINVSGR